MVGFFIFCYINSEFMIKLEIFFIVYQVVIFAFHSSVCLVPFIEPLVNNKVTDLASRYFFQRSAVFETLIILSSDIL